MSVDFAEDVTGSIKAAKPGPDVLGEWSSTKSTTERTMQALQTYKDIGDSHNEPLLKFHNPKSFEDFSKPIPNFKKFGLKAGEVPRFFDNVLQKRAGESVDKKNEWWAKRKDEVEQSLSGKEAAAHFPTLPVPQWQWAKPVPLQHLQQVTDAYFKALEPKRKLKLPTLPAQVTDTLVAYTKSLGQDNAVEQLKDTILKTLAERAVVEENGKLQRDFKYMTRAEVARKLASRRADVNNRWVKMWAKVIFTTPEQALVPLKERDHLLASKFADVSQKYNELVQSVSFGTESYGERMAHSEETNHFLLRHDRKAIQEALAPTPQELEAIETAKKLQDKAWALEQLLGPALKPEGASGVLPSEEAERLTEHLYSEDRYMYKEGKKLASRLRDMEQDLAKKLKELHGQDVDVRDVLLHPATPVQRLFEHIRNAPHRKQQFEAEKQKVGEHPYLLYAVQRREAFLEDPSNTAFEEVLYPKITEEEYEAELAELEARERWIDEAEEEELWTLTLLKQARHIHQNLDIDLPQAAVAHMDPLLYKKLDWEVTVGADLLHHEVYGAADCDQGQYLKDMYGLENLSHHFLPLIRYRRAKHRKLNGFWPPEVSMVPVKSRPLP